MPGKEAATPETFDEDDYANNLIDKEGYSEVTARMLAKKKKESMAAKKIEIDLGSLEKADDEEIEHLSPEERKKRREQRDKQQKERAAHRAVRQKQHEEVEAGIPEGKMESVGVFFKARKRVWVKATATKKGHYREMEVGQKEEKLSPKEKRIIYSEAFEEGFKHKELGMDYRDDDKYLHPKNEKEKIQADGYVDGWAEGYDEDAE